MSIDKTTRERLEAAQARLAAGERRTALIQLLRDARANNRNHQPVQVEAKLKEALRILGDNSNGG